MRNLFLLTFVFICIGCGSPTSNKTSTPSVDALTPEEQLTQRMTEWVDSTMKARAYFKQNLARILPEWGQDLQKRGQEEFSIRSDRKKLWFVYSTWEYCATATAYNKQLKNQFHELPDAVLKDIASWDIEQPKRQEVGSPQLRRFFAQECKQTYWIDDIDVRIDGKSNRYIHFIGSRFSKNKRIQEFHDEISETSEMLRFKQVRYSWCDGSGYQYFNVYDGKDSDPIPTILDWQYKWGVSPNAF